MYKAYCLVLCVKGINKIFGNSETFTENGFHSDRINS